MLQNLIHFSGHLVPEQFPQMSFVADARLTNPCALTVTDDPNEKLPTSGVGREEGLGDIDLVKFVRDPVWE